MPIEYWRSLAKLPTQLLAISGTCLDSKLIFSGVFQTRLFAIFAPQEGRQFETLPASGSGILPAFSHQSFAIFKTIHGYVGKSQFLIRSRWIEFELRVCQWSLGTYIRLQKYWQM